MKSPYLFHARFVVAKDVENNVVFISRKYYSEEKQRRAFRVASFSWFSGYPPTNLARLECKVSGF
jgi:tRNA-specific 2-thiouridylase